MKPVVFLGSSLDDLREFPDEARRAAGHELLQVQLGEEPSDFKPMPSIGKGAYEIRVHLWGEWRVVYVAKFKDSVYVLHSFQKKTQKTSQSDIELAAKRYKNIQE
ncbi:MAG: type II toxin-antitoxin system RelE/ParE family toxin [Planctomycetota bacterium]